MAASFLRYYKLSTDVNVPCLTFPITVLMNARLLTDSFSHFVISSIFSSLIHSTILKLYGYRYLLCNIAILSISFCQ